jgi:hypothetical protein
VLVPAQQADIALAGDVEPVLPGAEERAVDDGQGSAAVGARQTVGHPGEHIVARTGSGRPVPWHAVTLQATGDPHFVTFGTVARNGDGAMLGADNERRAA